MTSEQLSIVGFDRDCLGIFVSDGPFAPARGGQAGELFEAAGEMALVGEAAEFGDVGQFGVAGEEHAFGLEDLAFEEEMLGGDAEQFGESAMEMEWT